MAKRTLYLGIDIGGTKVLAGIMNSRFQILASHKLKVEAMRGERAFFKTLQDAVEPVLQEYGVRASDMAAIGVACPGIIRFPEGIVTLSPNLSFLKNCPLRVRLRKMFRAPVIVENDVNAGLYGEQQFGAARGARQVAGIFMGTGIGGALILDGKLYRGTFGGAGEIGHTHLSLPSAFSGIQAFTTLESMAGRLRIASEAAYLTMKQLAPNLYKKAGYDVKKMRSKALSKAVLAGDQPLEELMHSKAQLVGLSMANVVNLLNPELIVLGGGVVEAMGSKIVPAARETMRQYAMGPLVKDVRVVAAQLKDYAAVQGAAKLAHDTLMKPKKRR